MRLQQAQKRAFGQQLYILVILMLTSKGAAAVTGGGFVTAETFVTAWGQLNRPKLPPIEGRDDFAGPAFHSAHWDASVDLAGKRVAVIGNGASAIQFVPAVAKAAGTLTLFQRSPNWLVPRMNLTLVITREDGSSEKIDVLCRIDTLNEVEYFKAGGILHYVLRQLIAS